MRKFHSDRESERVDRFSSPIHSSPGKRTLTMDLADDSQLADATVQHGAASGSSTGDQPIVQRRASGAASSDASVPETAAQGIGAGGSLPYRAQMEALFGANFGDVRVHTGDRAVGASQAIGAEAYTMGNNIVLGHDRPTPSLIAHELTHVIQQRSGVGPSGAVGAAGDRWEQEADAAAASATSGQPVSLPYGPSAQLGGAVQRAAVQRYESGEHAQIGSGMNYPYHISEVPLPNGAMATTGELVAFGDFYADMAQLRNAPRQETEALIGLVRFEAIWQLAERQKHNAPMGGSATTDPKRPPHPKNGGASAPHHADARHLETATPVEWGDSVWDVMPPSCPSTLRQRATEIHAQFSPSWEFFGMSLPLSRKPNMNISAMRATLGRRRFRGANDALGATGTADPGHQGGDYFDLAANNVSHFAVSNWASWQAMHERACHDARDPAKLQNALVEDALGAHFLTDQFAAGHMIDKQDLMTEATSMVVQKSQQHKRSKPGDDKDSTLRDMLTEALQQCFDHDDVYEAWGTGCQRAHAQGFLRRDEMEQMMAIPRGNYAGNGMTIVGQIVNTIMAMPWRDNVDLRHPGAGPERSHGPADAQRGRGDYHLGLGNLAALQVHEAFNHIGFLASNEADNHWHMQGDAHLTAETQRIAHEAVKESQRQVQAKRSEPAKVKKYTPTKAKMLTGAFVDFFKGNHNGVMYDPRTLDALMKEVQKASEKEFKLLDRNGTMSPEIRKICHGILHTLFTAHPSDQDAADSGTGLNVSMLRAFLIERLPDMVAAAYASADVGDLPQAAQEAYVPRKADGTAMPSAANEFRWTGDTLDFKLNITGCASGSTFTLGMQVHNLDAGYDVSSTGQRIPTQLPVDTDNHVSTFEHKITIPTRPVRSESGRTYMDVPWKMHGRGAGNNESYVMVFADKGCNMVIGRSQTRGEGGVGNAKPSATAPRVTGADATRSGYARATGVVGDAFLWDGPTLRFRVTHNAPVGAPETSTVKVWYRTFVRNLAFDYGPEGNELEGSLNDKEIGGIREVSANIIGGESTDILLDPHDNAGDTYVVVYADSGRSQPLGRSDVQGSNRGTLSKQRQANAATKTSSFSWAGTTLSFKVVPTTARRVWVKFFNEDGGNDRDVRGNLLAERRIEDPQVGGIHALTVTSGHASIQATGDANNPGDTYAVVYADAACTEPVGRSGLQK